MRLRPSLGLVPLAAAALASALAGCNQDVQFTKAPAKGVLPAERRAPMTDVFVAVPLELEKLRARLEAQVPADVARVEEWVNRVACRTPVAAAAAGQAPALPSRRDCADARARGEVRRAGPIVLAGQGQRLEVRIPLKYEIRSRGVGQARDLEETRSGLLKATAVVGLTLSGTFEPQVRGLEEIAWTEAPNLPVFAGTANIAALLEARLKRALRTLPADFRASLSGEAMREVLALAWRRLHVPVETPREKKLWLRGAPESVHFAGLTGEGGEAAAVFAIASPVGVYLDERPMPLIARPMPELARTPPPAGDTTVSVPFDIDYEPIRKAVAAALPPDADFGIKDGAEHVPMRVSRAEVTPSARRLSIELTLSGRRPGRWIGFNGKAWLLATPAVDAESGILQLTQFAFAEPRQNLSLFVGGRNIIEKSPIPRRLEETVRIDLSGQLAGVLDWANRLIEVPIEDGISMRGTFGSVKVTSTDPLRDALRLNVEFTGRVLLRVDQPAGRGGTLADTPPLPQGGR